MNIRQTLIVIGFLLSVISVNAQETSPRQLYEQAEEEYTIGRISQAFSLLHDNLSVFEGNIRQNVFRLMALCCLSEDKDEEAEYYAEQLIRLNNYYNSTDDPVRFQDLINRLKEGFVSTITTASSQSETINEAPSPVTIITSEMIEELGYNKNLNQILAAYVPGMTEVASSAPGENLAMHGAYANGQELILIMENGHRLNNRFYNIGVTSYSISTEKIDHIEVLRGPASSLYGNVALSAVVNIITKSGRQLNGVKARYGYGSFNTHKADLLMGTQFMDADITAWASIYNSDGQIRHFNDDKGYYANCHEKPIYEPEYYTTTINASPDRIYVSSYKNMPSYDLGFSFKLNGFELMLSRKSYTKLYPISLFDTGYDYDLYQTITDIKPGNSIEETHIELGYSHPIGKVNLKGTLYTDWYKSKDYEVYCDYSEIISPIHDEYDQYVYDEDGNMVFESRGDWGTISFASYREKTFGGIVNATTDYRVGRMKGNFLAGSQYEHFILDSRLYFMGSDFKQIEYGNYNFYNIVGTGEEDNLSFFLQAKHYFTPRFIANLGFRYDLKYRLEENLSALSPRLALMYTFNDYLTMKLSYAQSFSDLALYYRYLFSDLVDMNPQRLSAVQFTAMGKASPLHLQYEISLFYNHYRNLMQWNERQEEEQIDIEKISNQGTLENIGIEVTASYAHKRFSSNLSLYYVHDISCDNYYYNNLEKRVNNVPLFTLNLHGAYKLLQTANHELKVYAHPSYTGRKLNFTPFQATDYYIDGKWKLDLGVKYSFRRHLSFSLDCENLFNTSDYVCGPVNSFLPLFQRGRNLMASVSYQF